MKTIGLAAALCGVLACTDKGVQASPSTAHEGSLKSTTQIARDDSIRKDSIERARIARVPRPEVVRGLYVNRWAAIGRKMGQLIELANRTEVNALVIDVKDDRGFVLYKSRVPLAIEIGADTNSAMSDRKLRAILDKKTRAKKLTADEQAFLAAALGNPQSSIPNPQSWSSAPRAALWIHRFSGTGSDEMAAAIGEAGRRQVFDEAAHHPAQRV